MTLFTLCTRAIWQPYTIERHKIPTPPNLPWITNTYNNNFTIYYCYYILIYVINILLYVFVTETYIGQIKAVILPAEILSVSGKELEKKVSIYYLQENRYNILTKFRRHNMYKCLFKIRINMAI